MDILFLALSRGIMNKRNVNEEAINDYRRYGAERVKERL